MAFAELLHKRVQPVEKRLGELLKGANVPARLIAAMRHVVLGGGKRLRPFLLLEAARLHGAKEAAGIDAAAALELLHCYSLAHDDLPSMDNDDLRRGQPTAHIAFGEATAILAGDALLTLAFETLARPHCHSDPAVRAELVLSLALAAGAEGMVGGQMLDLEAEGRFIGAAAGPEVPVGQRQPRALSQQQIRDLQARKTGALLRHACEAGAIIAGGTANDRKRMCEFGKLLGAAFQLADDLLDVTADAAELGKATGKDADAGKATLVGLMGIEAAREQLAGLGRSAEIVLETYGDRAKTLIAATRFIIERRN